MKDNLEKFHRNEYNALYLLTIHKSKGLTFDNVFIIGFYDGGIPSSRSVLLEKANLEEGKQKAEPPCILEEERRLMYVAMTRPRNNLYITFPRKLQGKPIIRSRFLKELMLPITVNNKR